MKINLDDWRNQRDCTVTLRNGTKHNVNITQNMVDCRYPYYWVGLIQGYHLRYFKSGKYYETKEEHIWDIIHIKELPMNTEQILSEITKTQDQLNKLQEELKKAEAQEKLKKEFYTPIDDESSYLFCLKLLKTENVDYLGGCFDWCDTPQGPEYWQDISNRETNLSEYNIQQIKDWVINYLIQKELN